MATVVLASSSVIGLLAWRMATECAERSGARLVCLMYHRFVTAGDYARLGGKERVYSIDVGRFEAQLRHLRDEGYVSVSVREAVDFVRGRCSLPPRAVLITIDDGCRSVLTRAEPLLRRYGMRAALFLTIDADAPVFGPPGSPQARLTDAEVAALDPETIEVHSHGVTHRPLSRLSGGEVVKELRESRSAIEQLTGHPVTAVAIPGNWYDRRVLDLARRAGYEAVFVSDPGTNGPGDDPFRLRRVTVAGYCTRAAFADLLTAEGAARRRFGFEVRRAAVQAPEWVCGALARSRLDSTSARER